VISQYQHGQFILKSHFLISSAFVFFSTFSNAQFDSGLDDDRLCKADCKYEYRMFRKYAQKGSSIALYSVGIMQLRGQGTEKNNELGFKHIQRAAIAGDPGANAQMGYFYLFGLYTEFNLESAQRHLNFAAEKGVGESQRVLDLITSYQQSKSNMYDMGASQPTEVEKKDKLGTVKGYVTEEDGFVEVIQVSSGLNYRDTLAAAQSQVCKSVTCDYFAKIAFVPKIRIANELERLAQLYP